MKKRDLKLTQNNFFFFPLFCGNSKGIISWKMIINRPNYLNTAKICFSVMKSILLHKNSTLFSAYFAEAFVSSSQSHKVSKSQEPFLTHRSAYESTPALYSTLFSLFSLLLSLSLLLKVTKSQCHSRGRFLTQRCAYESSPAHPSPLPSHPLLVAQLPNRSIAKSLNHTIKSRNLSRPGNNST